MWFTKKIKIGKEVEEKTPEMKQEEWEKHLKIFKENLMKHHEAQKEIIKHLKEIGCFQDPYVEVTNVSEAIQKVLRKRWVIEEHYLYVLNEWESFYLENTYKSGRREDIPISNLQMNYLEALAGNNLPLNYKLSSDWYEINSHAFDSDIKTDTYPKNYHTGHFYYHKPTGIIVKCLLIPKDENKVLDKTNEEN